MLTDVFLPLLTYPEANSTHGVDDALHLADHFATKLRVTAFEIDVPNISRRLGPDVVDVAGLATQAEAASHAEAVRLIEHVRQAIKEPTVTADIARVADWDLVEECVKRARTHDLTMLLLDPSTPIKRGLVETLIFGSGRPTIIVPDFPQRRNVNQIAIAWDGSREASMAIHDAMPLIVKADGVEVITAFDDKAISAVAVQEITAYLARHGVKAVSHDISLADKAIGVALQDGAMAHGAGLLVMGAFGHSRIRDFILGGATRTILENLRMPVFFSH